MICTIFLCSKKCRSPCSFKRKGLSHLLRFPLDGEYPAMFEKQRTDLFALSTISTLSLSFLFLLCHKFPPLFPNHAFPKCPFFLRASFPARKATIIFCCQLRVIMRSTGCAVQYWGVTLSKLICKKSSSSEMMGKSEICFILVKLLNTLEPFFL